MTSPTTRAESTRPRSLLTRPDPALLVLEDGTVLRGSAYGARGARMGEGVFATGMTGYQETLSDPSYVGQIVVQTAPHIGNTGATSQDIESPHCCVRGYAVPDASRLISSRRAEQSLYALLESEAVVGIADIDTRMLTRRLRASGTMRGGVFFGNALSETDEALV